MDSEELMDKTLKQLSSTELQKLSTCRKCGSGFTTFGEENGYGFVNFRPDYFCDTCKAEKHEKVVFCLRCKVETVFKGELCPFGVDGFILYPGEKEHCPDCQKIVQEELLQVQIESEVRNVGRILSAYGMPPKLNSISYELPGFLKPYIPPIEYQIGSSAKGICLSGSSGVGKTFAMAMLIRDWTIAAIKGQSKHLGHRGVWRFLNYPSFIMNLQDSYRDEKSSPLTMLDKVTNTPYLVIDDLGVEKPTEFVKQSTYYILNEREMNMRATFITTNFTMNQLNDFIDQRISSRIAGMCDIKEIKGKDRRLERK